MMKYSLRATRLLVAGFVASGTGCTLTVTGGDNDGGPSDFDAAADASRDAFVAEAAPLGDGGLSCQLPDGSDACTLCLAANCCREEVACNSEPTDAGTTECEDIASCYNDCVSPPADSGIAPGTSMDCVTACFASHSAQAQSDFSAVKTCTATFCSTSCQ